MTEQYDTRPAHQRLEGFSVRHLNNILKHLSGGSVGFDTSRDERTNSKEKLIEYIRFIGSGEQSLIDSAHDKARAEYGDGGNGFTRFQSSRRSRRFNAQTGAASAGEHTSESAAQTTQQAAQTTTQTVSVASSEDKAGALARVLAEILGGKSPVDEAQVRTIAADEVSKGVAGLRDRIEAAERSAVNGVRTLEIVQNELPPINVGRQHKRFDVLLKACNTKLRDGHRLNVWLAGPAGTGKTTAAKMVAKALGLAFHFNGAVDSPYKLSGFIDANGRCIRTPFREAYEKGGVYLFDEIDASSPSAILEFNAPLANGAYAFPDGIVERHPDCIIIAGANTTGLGASLEYVGRMKQDAALLNRFVMLDWPLDEGLEASFCVNDAWHARVLQVRERVKARGVKGTLVTPRATIYGEALLSAGIDQETVEAMVLRQGMAADQWSMVR